MPSRPPPAKTLSIASPPVSSNPPGNSETPTAEVPVAPEIRYGVAAVQRIKTALGRITERPETPTAARNLLQGFAKVCNPKLDRSSFPVTHHPCPLNPDNARDGESKWLVLYNIIGCAINAVQECYRKRIDVKDAERRITILEVLSDYKIDALEITGNGVNGYTLAPKETK